jgi:hypothetical protein
MCRACATENAWDKPEYKKNHINGCLNGWTSERRQISRNSFNKLWAMPTFRKKVIDMLHSETVQRKSMHFHKRKHVFAFDVNFKSTYEYRLAKALNENKIKWQYETKRFKILYTEGKNKYYYPDFYLPEYDLWIETKGYWFEGQKEKFAKFQEQYPDIKIKVFYDTQIKLIEARDVNEIIK